MTLSAETRRNRISASAWAAGQYQLCAISGGKDLKIISRAAGWKTLGGGHGCGGVKDGGGFWRLKHQRAMASPRQNIG